MRFYLKMASLMTSVLALTALVSCSEKSETTPEYGTYKLSVTAAKSGGEPFDFFNGSTKVLVPSTTTDGREAVKAEWKAGETVKVFQIALNEADYEAHGCMYYVIGTLTAQSSGAVTTLSGTVTGTFTFPTSSSSSVSTPPLLLAYKNPDSFAYDYTGQDGTLATISDKYDYAMNQMYLTGVNGDTLNGRLMSSAFFGYQSIAKFVLTDESGNPLKPTKLTLSTSGESEFIQLFKPNAVTPSVASNPSSNPYLLAVTTGPIEVVPSGETNEIYVALSGNANGQAVMGPVNSTTLTLTAVVGNDTYSFTKPEFSIAMNKFYVFNVPMTKVVE
ncbi:MAG: hypothetical protein K5910_01150 [Bacteroidales bacterium]|nr:hypothetical protein [Bacteroidales bacterium]